MNNTQEKRNDNDSKKIVTMLVLVFTLMFCTTGATYAYFAISAASENAISGEAANVANSLILTNTTGGTVSTAIPYIAPTTTSNQQLKMVPQISYSGTTNVLQNAFNGASGKDKCVDANGNVICKAYTFVVKNLSNANMDVRGYIKFTYGTGSSFANLRWKLMTSATSVTVSTATAGTTFSDTAPIISSTSKVYFDEENVALASGGGYQQYWLIVWIEETNGDQNSTDYGTWYATIGFDAFNEAGASIGGLTSTITS